MGGDGEGEKERLGKERDAEGWRGREGEMFQPPIFCPRAAYDL
jgi:hypothetical protein